VLNVHSRMNGYLGCVDQVCLCILGMGAPKKKGMIVLENMQQSSKDHEYENY